MSKVDQNRLYAQRLGWSPTEWGATAFDDLLVQLITTYQQLRGVTADGVAGPVTYGLLLEQRQRELVIAQRTATDPEAKLVAAGKVAVLELLRVWLVDIVDLPPPGSPRFNLCQTTIDQAIRTHMGIDWSWEELYRGRFKWCGAFAARGAGAAGVHLDVRRSYYSSTYRLDRFATYQRHNATTPNPKPATGPYRSCIELDEKSVVADLGSFVPRAGDIALVGQAKGVKEAGFLDCGTHVATVEWFDATTGIVHTIEGNGTGLGPFGIPQHGVVRASRPVGIHGGASPAAYHVRRLIRLAPSDVA